MRGWMVGGLILVGLVGSTEAATRGSLSQCLQVAGVRPEERTQLIGRVSSAHEAIESARLHWKGTGLPAPVESAFHSASRIIHVHHLGGDQATELLADLMIQLNPRVQQAGPALQRLQAMMAEHHVSGADLYDFMEPILELGVQARLTGQGAPLPSLADVSRVNAFVNAHGLSLDKLVECLKELRAAVND